MALSRRKRVTTIILDAGMDQLLNRAANETGVSRSEFIRAQLRRVLDQFRDHPKPRSAGIIRGRFKGGDEAELFRELER